MEDVFQQYVWKLKNVIIVSDLDIWMRSPRSGYKFFLTEYENYNNFFYHYYKNLNLLDISRITRMFIEKYFFLWSEKNNRNCKS